MDPFVLKHWLNLQRSRISSCPRTGPALSCVRLLDTYTPHTYRYNVSELKKTVFKDNYKNLEEYLEGFKYTSGVMQDSKSCERVAYEFAIDNYEEGVRYFEVRFAPQLHASIDPEDKFGIREVLKSVDRGLKRARDAFNKKLHADKSRSEEPRYEYGIICCAMRKFFKGMSRFYDGLYALHPDESADEITSMASVILVQAVQKSRDIDKIVNVCGVDIAGAERGNEAAVHEKAFDLAHRYFFHKTVHAGEGFGPESIGQAVKYLHAERIGHGFHLFNVDQVVTKDVDAAHYVKSLVNWISDLRITMEVCLTSNLNTMPKLKLEDHPFGKMVRNRISVTINTDNRLVSNTSTVEELKKAAYTFDLTAKQLRELVITGFKRSFFPGDYPTRRKYVRQVIDFYDSICRKHGIDDCCMEPITPTK